MELFHTDWQSRTERPSGWSRECVISWPSGIFRWVSQWEFNFKTLPRPWTFVPDSHPVFFFISVGGCCTGAFTISGASSCVCSGLSRRVYLSQTTGLRHRSLAYGYRGPLLPVLHPALCRCLLFCSGRELTGGWSYILLIYHQRSSL